MKQRNQPPIFKVLWTSKDNPTIVYEKIIPASEQKAKEFAQGNSALIFKLSGANKKGKQWQMVETETSKEFVKDVEARKQFAKYSNASGANDLGQTTTVEFQKSQRARLVGSLVAGPAVLYVGARYALPNPLRVLLITIGAATIYFNGKNYLRNRKMNKNS